MTARVYLSRQATLALSHAGDSGLHSHRATQLCLTLDSGVCLERDGSCEELRESALLAPQQPHRLSGDGQRLAVLFADPGPRAFQQWWRAGGRPRPVDTALHAELQSAFATAPDYASGASLATRLREHCLPELVDAAPEDARIARALSMIEAEPTVAEHSFRALAGRLHLSPSRFATLFSTHAGMPVRNYVLWCRLQAGLRRLQAGDSVTTAAHAAGFADAAHFSRSVRRVLGAAPSELDWAVASGGGPPDWA